MEQLRGQRGIAQIYNTAFVQVKWRDRLEYKRVSYGELYDTDLSKCLCRCNYADLQVIVKDLVYAMLVLEGKPGEKWIRHGDIKKSRRSSGFGKSSC